MAICRSCCAYPDRFASQHRDREYARSINGHHSGDCLSVVHSDRRADAIAHADAYSIGQSHAHGDADSHSDAGALGDAGYAAQGVSGRLRPRMADLE